MALSDFSNIVIEGSSQSGKTTFAKQLVQDSSKLFSTPPESLIYVYEFYDDSFDRLKNESNMNVTLTQSLPKFEALAEHCSKYSHSLLVIDDCTSEKLIKNQYFVDLFCKGSHHLKMSVVLNCHDIISSSSKNRNLSTILKGAHVYVIMSCPKNRQKLLSISKQTHNFRFLKEIFADATRNCTPYCYLVCNFHPTCPKILRYCTNIFSGDSLDHPLTLYQEVDDAL